LAIVPRDRLTGKPELPKGIDAGIGRFVPSQGEIGSLTHRLSSNHMFEIDEDEFMPIKSKRGSICTSKATKKVRMMLK
jgi:hypothetical protein